MPLRTLRSADTVGLMAGSEGGAEGGTVGRRVCLRLGLRLGRWLGLTAGEIAGPVVRLSVSPSSRFLVWLPRTVPCPRTKLAGYVPTPATRLDLVKSVTFGDFFGCFPGITSSVASEARWMVACESWRRVVVVEAADTRFAGEDLVAVQDIALISNLVTGCPSSI